MTAEEQAAASLATVESLTLGAAAVPHRERAAEHFEALIQRQLRRVALAAPRLGADRARHRRRHPQHRLPPPPRRAAASELPASGRADRRLGPGFDRPPGERAAALRGRPPARAEPAATAAGRAPQPDAARRSSKRERIVRAATRLGFENGYEALSIPAISAAAGVSNQTFYDHFPGKQEAFLAGFDALAAETMQRRRRRLPAPRRERRPEAVGAGLRALLEHVAADELFARLAFFELPMAGPAALDQADRDARRLHLLLQPAGAGRRRRPPPVILRGDRGRHLGRDPARDRRGPRRQLPELAPQIAEFALTPFG